MLYESACDLVNQITGKWPDLCANQFDRERWLGALVEADEAASKRAVAWLVDGWKERRNPTVLDLKNKISSAVRETWDSRKLIAFDRRVADYTARFGAVFLAIHAKPSDKPCEFCTEHYTQRGLVAGDPMLNHEHFALRETEADFALGIACWNASHQNGEDWNPLEARCVEMTKEQRALMMRKLREKVGGLFANVVRA